MELKFRASAIKIERAKHHLSDLQMEINSYFERGLAKIVFEEALEYNQTTRTRTGSFTYREKEPIPLIWSAIIGDIIHNLRSSLDLIAAEIFYITKGNPQEISYVYYPFCKKKDQLYNTIKQRRLSRAGSKFLSVIDSTRPYKDLDGNKGLYAIHELDILDKHQSLLPTLSVVEVDWPVEIKKGSQKFGTKVDKDGQRIMIFPLSFMPLPDGAPIKANFSLVFGEAGLFMGTDVVKQLDACIGSVDHILKLFRDAAAESPAGRIHPPSP